MIAETLRLNELSRSVWDSGVEKRVLAPLNYVFEPGRFHVVSGPSGAGKTTLLSLLALAAAPSRGRILWGDTNLLGLTARRVNSWRRANLGIIFQHCRLVSVMSAMENVRLAGAIRGMDVATEGRRLLSLFGLGHRLDQRPGQLSGGEKQRVAIAQTLACRPRLLLADEPTAALDSSNAAFVTDTLRGFARTASAVVICVSHDPTVIQAADSVLTLDRP